MTENKQYEIMKDLSGYFRAGQRKEIYNSCDNWRDKLLIRLLWKSGRRIGEVLLVKVSDIDFENSSILWHIEKKSKKVNGKKVKKDLRTWKPIDNFTLRLIKLFVNEQQLSQDSLLFQSPINEKKPITRQRAFQIVRKVCEKAGINYVGNKKPHPHHFRHTFAIEMAKKMKTPADFRKLQILLEHANLGITEQYLQFSDSEIRELLERTDDND
jgi:integrase/recombinase XerD